MEIDGFEGMDELRLRGSLTLAIECICCGAVVALIAS